MIGLDTMSNDGTSWVTFAVIDSGNSGCASLECVNEAYNYLVRHGILSYE